MFNLSGSELVFLVLIALVVLGPDKLPEAMRKAGKAYADFKRMTSGFQSEMKSVLDEPLRELRETAEMAKQAATFDLNPLSPKPGTPATQTGVGPTDLSANKPAVAASPIPAVTPAAWAEASSSTPAFDATTAFDGTASPTNLGAPPIVGDATSRRLAAAQPVVPAPEPEVAAAPVTDAVAPPRIVDAVVASGVMTGFTPAAEPAAEAVVAHDVVAE
ncbi:MAG: tatB [Acidimicrobiales bacterium]|nr:tatB [Acidimicrobiales bacterium]